MHRNGLLTMQFLCLALSAFLATGCSPTSPPLPKGAPLADYHPPSPPRQGHAPMRAKIGLPPAAVIATLHRLADAVAVYAERHAVPGSPDVTLAEPAARGYLDERFAAGYADRQGYRFSGAVGSWGFTLAAVGLGPESGLDCYIDSDRIVCTDPACTRPLADIAENRRTARLDEADTPTPSAAPPNDHRNGRARLLDVLTEIEAFLSSPRLTDCLVDGSLDSRRLKERLDTFILRHFHSLSLFEDASRQWKDDPEVKRAGGALLNTLQKAFRRHGIRIAGP